MSDKLARYPQDPSFYQNQDAAFAEIWQCKFSGIRVPAHQAGEILLTIFMIFAPFAAERARQRGIA